MKTQTLPVCAFLIAATSLSRAADTNAAIAHQRMEAIYDEVTNTRAWSIISIVPWAERNNTVPSRSRPRKILGKLNPLHQSCRIRIGDNFIANPAACLRRSESDEEARRLLSPKNPDEFENQIRPLIKTTTASGFQSFPIALPESDFFPRSACCALR
jgi:hypothetical protein